MMTFKIHKDALDRTSLTASPLTTLATSLYSQ